MRPPGKPPACQSEDEILMHYIIAPIMCPKEAYLVCSMSKSETAFFEQTTQINQATRTQYARLETMHLPLFFL